LIWIRPFQENSIKENPEYCPAHYQLGHFYLSEKKYPEALKSFKEAAYGTCVEYSAPLYYQAQALQRAGKKQDAQKIYLELLRRFPEDQEIKNRVERELSLFTRQNNLNAPIKDSHNIDDDILNLE